MTLRIFSSSCRLSPYPLLISRVVVPASIIASRRRWAIEKSSSSVVWRVLLTVSIIPPLCGECRGRRLLRVVVEILLLLILERLGGCAGLQSRGGLSHPLRVCALKPSTFFGVVEMMPSRRFCPY